MDQRAFLMQAANFPDRASAAQFSDNWRPGAVRKGACLVEQGQRDNRELIILQGYAVGRIHGPDGGEACVGLYAGPCTVTPNIARTRGGASIVSLEAASDALVTTIDSDLLGELMVGSSAIREWANGVLREELARKADREWCLAALGGADRLAWFRERYPGYEDIFVHSLIASFLGMTPVTLSRLRKRNAAG